MKRIRIVPPPPSPNGLVMAQGTRVYVDDVEIPDIISIHLYAKVDDLWRAEIECFASIDETVFSSVAIVHRRPWYRRWLDSIKKYSAFHGQ